jgi:aldehyde dehydrogenase (NAD+)
MSTATIEAPSAKVPKNENDSLQRIQEVFQLQQGNLQALKNTKAKERRKKLQALKKLIFDNKAKIHTALLADFKKPSIETDITEIYPSISEIKHALNHFEDWMQPEEVDAPITLLGSSAYIHFEPKGSCLIITPWNYPFYLAISPLVYAIAAGNAVILKPSEFTPNTSLLLKELLANVFQENEVAVVLGDHEVSGALLKLKFNHIHFTGSPNVGKLVMEAASKHLTSCTLELGGKSPSIVDETANIEEAAKKIVWGKYLNEGQTCIAPDYVLVHHSKQSALIEAMKKQVQKKYGEQTSQRMESNNLCRMVNAKHYSRVKGLADAAIADGAVLEMGGNYQSEENFIDPTILSNVSKSSSIMHEEIFGPIMPVLSFQTLEEAVALIQDKERPLALYIFSKKEKNIEYLMQHTSAGGTCINDTILHITQPNLPFGGVNNSGLGKSHGKWGFVDFSNERSVLRQHFSFGMSQLLHPPYTKFTQFVIDMTMRFF